MSSRLGRLLGMAPEELCERARQGLSKWMERRRERPPAWPRFDDRLLAGLPAPGLPSSPEETIPALDAACPAARKAAVAGADWCLTGRFDLLGYQGLSFGEPLDWHLDPVAGRRAPFVHWSRIDPLSTETVGDSKVIWELNRHQWLVYLAQAYRLTGDRKYAETCVAHLDSWIEANPRGIGINWASSLEVAFRLIAWCWILHLFGTSGIGDRIRARLVSALWAHGRHIERYLSYYFSPNTHLTGEALGLVYAGLLLRGLPRSERWRRLGGEILEREAPRQILADGIYFEQSTYYQRYTAEIYLHYLALCRDQVSAGTRHRVRLLLDGLLSLLRPDGTMPQIGDADGGWLLRLERRHTDDVRGVFSTAAVVFENPEYAWAARGLQPETVWLLGPAAVDIYGRLTPHAPLGEPTRVFPDGGYAVLRSTWEPNADQVILDAGPLGCPYSSGHGHADLLAVQCAFRGREFVVDPGTGTYTSAGGRRTYFRGTSAHSTVQVDGVDQAGPTGPFAWSRKPSARLVGWQVGSSVAWAEGEHRAYASLPDPVVHRRRVFLISRGGYCFIVDDLEGQTEHRLDLRFQLAPGQALLGTDQWVRVDGAGLEDVMVRAFSSNVLKVRLSEGEVDPRAGWVSPEYGVERPAPMLTYTAVARLPVRILTALIPGTRVVDLSTITPLTDRGRIVGIAIGQEAFHLDRVSAGESAA